jgi:hypothetical protein
MGDENFKIESHGGMLYHHRRMLSDGQIIFLVNSSLDESLTGELNVKGADAVELNTFRATISRLPHKVNDRTVKLPFTLPPAGSMLLFVPDRKKTSFEQEPVIKEMFPVELAFLEISPNEDNSLMIDFCDLELENEISEDLHTFMATDRVFKHFGFKNGNPWNSSVQFRKTIVDRDKFDESTGFASDFHFNITEEFDWSDLRAVIERPWLWRVSINGIEVKQEPGQWWLDRSFGVFRIGSYIFKGRNTITLTISPMKVHAEIEPVYILGDFSLSSAEKGWSLDAPDTIYSMASWRDQGMPFYSRSMTYSSVFNTESSTGKWFIQLGKWNGTVAEVYVNGKAADPVAFPPHLTDISGLVKTGKNKVDVKVIGSLKNLLGPHHNNPAPGLVHPGLWRNVKAYPPGKDYQMIDYGLFEEFRVLRSTM